MSGVFHVRLGSPGGRVDLDMVERLAEHLRGAFREKARQLGAEGKIGVRLEITEFRKGSVILDIEPHLTAEDAPDAFEVAARIIDDIEAIGQDRSPLDLDNGLLNHYSGFIRLAESSGALALGIDERVTRIDSANRVHFEAALAETAVPSVRLVGTIETVNVHRRPHNFGLYTSGDRQRVECRFPNEMLEPLLEFLESGTAVEVFGEGRFAPVGLYPRVLDVQTLPIPVVRNSAALLAMYGRFAA